MSVSSLKCFFDKKYFYISNCDVGCEEIGAALRGEADKYVIYGHCFVANDIIKDREITKEEFDYIAENHENLSGLFVCIGVISGRVEIYVDPLVQYPIFYYNKNGVLAISNKLSMLSRNHYSGPCMTYLYDSLIYRAPLRGLTPVESVKMIQFDDLQEGSEFRFDFDNLEIWKTNLLYKGDVSYEEALSELARNIKARASIIARKFNYIECQLSGGLDCRMVASAFLSYDNVAYYSLGLDSQDRLCFESLADKFKLRKITEIRYYGRGSHDAAYRTKMIDDLNAIKLHSYGGYMNYGKAIGPDGCKLTGYFGEYVGHKLPSGNISPKDGSVINDPHIECLPEGALDVENEYSRPFWRHNSKTRRCGSSARAINQLFYLNNRGPSHFGMNSAVDNLYDNSFNVLYDPIALTVSELSPYTDYENKEGATCIDLICELTGPEFALFPYEGRKIPRYRDFEYIPNFNCFEKHVFERVELDPITKEMRPTPSLARWETLKNSRKLVNNVDILNDEIFDSFFKENLKLKHLRVPCKEKVFHIQQEILCNFLLADLFFSEERASVAGR